MFLRLRSPYFAIVRIRQIHYSPISKPLLPHFKQKIQHVHPWNYQRRYETNDGIRMMIYQWRNIILSGCMVMVCAGTIFWFFGDDIKIKLSGHGADVVSDSIGNPVVVDKASRLSREVVEDILRNENTREQARVFTKTLLTNLFHDESMKKEAVEFVGRVLLDTGTKESVYCLIDKLAKDDKTKKLVAELLMSGVHHVLDNAAVRKHAYDFLVSNQNQDALVVLLESLINNPKSLQMVTNLALNGVHNVLDNNQVKNHAHNFVLDQLRDDEFQKQGSDTIYSFVTGAFYPTWLISDTSEKNEEDSNKEVEENNKEEKK